MHLNGPIGVGKSTIADGLIGSRRLALHVDVDELRVRLGGWRNDTEAKSIARALGFGLARSHLESGYDVALPQLLVRFEVIDQVASIAASAGAEFIEVVLVAPVQEILNRLDDTTVRPHPRDHLSREELREHIDYALKQLHRRVDVQPNALLVDVGNLGVDEARAAVQAAIRW